MSISETQVFTIPDLTLSQARVLDYHYHEGRMKRDRMVNFKTMVETLEARHNCGFWADATKLRDKFDPPMLLYEDGKPLLNAHRIHETFFRDPKPLYEAINAAERKAQVTLTPCPDVEGSVGVAMAQPSQTAGPSYKPGDVILQPDGSLAELCRGPKGLYLKPVAMKSEPDTPKPTTRARASGRRGAGARPVSKPTSRLAVVKGVNAPAKVTAKRPARGHEVA